MEKMTITEALSEINLINKKIESKKAKILGSLTRFDHVADPYTSVGGSEKMIKEETQSMKDLMSKLTRVRAAVSQANINNTITVNQRTRTIHDWLTWKREISKGEIAFVTQVGQQIKVQMDTFSRQPQLIKSADGNGEPQLAKLRANVDYAQWMKEAEDLTETQEKLDGQLSLKNATIFVEV